MDALRAALKEIVREVVREELDARSVEKPTDEYISTVDAAALAGVTPGTIRRWKDEGKLTPAGAGRELRFLRSEVTALMQRVPSARGRAILRARPKAPEAIGDEIVRRLVGR